MTEKDFDVRWAEEAVRDLDRIVDYVEREAPLAAQRLFDQIAARAVTLANSPLRGRRVPELARFEISNYRELLISPYRLIYRVDASRVWVVAIFDGRRDLEDILLSRLVDL